jgi:hypothetical protein
MKTVGKMSFICGVALFWATLSVAQDKPSYNETLDFIKSKLITEIEGSSGSGHGIMAFNLSEKNKCEFVYVRTMRAHHDEGLIHNQMRSTVKFSDLDPSRLKLDLSINSYGYTTLVLITREIQEVIRVERKPLPGCQYVCYTSSRGSSKLRIATHDPNRLMRAVSHLIELCGGRKELF